MRLANSIQVLPGALAPHVRQEVSAIQVFVLKMMGSLTAQSFAEPVQKGTLARRSRVVSKFVFVKGYPVKVRPVRMFVMLDSIVWMVRVTKPASRVEPMNARWEGRVSR